MDIPACAAITAVTAQGPDGVAGRQLIPGELIRRQIVEAFKYLPVAAAKIGMLGDGEQVEAVANALRDVPKLKIVLDPVLTSSSGHELLSVQARQALLDLLMPLCTVITPNLDELRVLTNLPVSTEEERISAAKCLLERGASAVLVKGGHSADKPADYLVGAKEVRKFQGRRIHTAHGRGTGCVLSSLISCYLSMGKSLEYSVESSKAVLEFGLERSMVPLRGFGYPRLGPESAQIDKTDRIKGIYFVSDHRLNKEVTHLSGADCALNGGASVIQMREKEMTSRELCRLARRFQRLLKDHHIFIVNDRVDIALEVNADGVHLGPDDMNPEDARQLLGPSKIIGVSVSTVEEAKAYAKHASYLAVGAIFGSSTKGDAGDPVGIERITEIKNAFPDKKIVAIGGINLSNIASVAAAGADAAAVVSAIVCAPDPEQATRDLLAEFNRGKAQRNL